MVELWRKHAEEASRSTKRNDGSMAASREYG